MRDAGCDDVLCDGRFGAPALCYWQRGAREAGALLRDKKEAARCQTAPNVQLAFRPAPRPVDTTLPLFSAEVRVPLEVVAFFGGGSVPAALPQRMSLAQPTLDLGLYSRFLFSPQELFQRSQLSWGTAVPPLQVERRCGGFWWRCASWSLQGPTEIVLNAMVRRWGRTLGCYCILRKGLREEDAGCLLVYGELRLKGIGYCGACCCRPVHRLKPLVFIEGSRVKGRKAFRAAGPQKDDARARIWRNHPG